MAMADFGVHPEGRELLRREGAIRPLVLLLGEGIESPAAEQAAKALMTLAASDINKVAGHDCSTQVTVWLAARGCHDSGMHCLSSDANPASTNLPMDVMDYTVPAPMRTCPVVAELHELSACGIVHQLISYAAL